MREAVLLSVAVILIVAGSVSAQSDKEWWGNFAFSYVEPMGATADAVDPSWGFVGGVTYQPSGSRLGILGELAWNDLDAPSLWAEDGQGNDVLLEGRAEVWSLTVNGVWRAPTDGTVGFYVVGGLGAYKRNLQVTTPTGYDYIYWCDPWWGICYGDAVPVDAVLADDSTTKLGYNLGLGATFKIGYATELYIEARYNWVETAEATEYIPIALGIRF
jgi:hypothetical protein